MTTYQKFDKAAGLPAGALAFTNELARGQSLHYVVLGPAANL